MERVIQPPAAGAPDSRAGRTRGQVQLGAGRGARSQPETSRVTVLTRDGSSDRHCWFAVVSTDVLGSKKSELGSRGLWSVELAP